MPPLRDGDVALRRVRADDAPAYVRAFAQDPDLGRWLGSDADPTEAEIRRRAERHGPGVELAITDAGDALVGSVMVHHVEPRHGRAEIGFWVAPAARGRGLGRRAVELVVDWLFSAGSLRRLELTTTPDNLAARALALRLGFTEEGTLRARDVERGRPVDVVWFGLLRDEWPP